MPKPADRRVWGFEGPRLSVAQVFEGSQKNLSFTKQDKAARKEERPGTKKKKTQKKNTELELLLFIHCSHLV